MFRTLHLLVLDAILSAPPPAGLKVYVSKGFNTDGKAWSTPASVGSLEDFETDDSSTLYDAVVECRVIKSAEEIAMMQHINNLSSEAHFEARAILPYHAVPTRTF